MVSALYVRKDSIYKTMGLDCWDADRDARLWPGGNPCICHPPCAQWSRLRGLSNDVPELKALAPLAVQQVRRWGGVLEHPRDSVLWKEVPLPYPGWTDQWNGYSILIDQSWFGHKARKKTLLYIVGIAQRDLPPIPYSLDAICYTIGSSKGSPTPKKNVSKAEREHTPRRLAEWMVEVCNKVVVNKTLL